MSYGQTHFLCLLPQLVADENAQATKSKPMPMFSQNGSNEIAITVLTFFVNRRSYREAICDYEF